MLDKWYLCDRTTTSVRSRALHQVPDQQWATISETKVSHSAGGAQGRNSLHCSCIPALSGDRLLEAPKL